MKIKYDILIEPKVIEDIQNGIDWYNDKQNGLRTRFHKEVKSSFQKLLSSPFFQIRYDNVRCFPLKTFPYMIHFTLNEEESLIIIRALLNTSRNPQIWKTRN